MAWGSGQLDATICRTYCKTVDAWQGWDVTDVLAAKMAGRASCSAAQMKLCRSSHCCAAITRSIQDRMIRAKARVAACRIGLRIEDCVCAMFVSVRTVFVATPR